MQTVRQAISDIINDLKSYDLDDKFSYRFIASKLKGNIENFLKQDAVDRTILKINELWKPLTCITLKDAYDPTCSPFYEQEYTSLRVSEKKIPEVYTTKFGNLIKIINLNNSNEYTQTKSFLYKDISNRAVKYSKIKYYWIEDGYLYIPDSNTDEVRGFGLFKDSQEADFFNGTVDCCYKPLDSLLLVPDYIIKIAKEEVVQQLAGVSKQLVEDTNPNLNSNIK